MGRKRWGIAVVALGLSVAGLVAVPAPVSPAGAVGTAGSYIVETVAGVDPAAVAKRYGIDNAEVFRLVFTGFAAPLTAAEQRSLQGDRDVQGVRFDASRFTVVPFPLPIIDGSDIMINQLVPRQVRRVGADRSPTANIDGRDDRVDVDIAVLDSGVDITHPELNVAGGRTCIGLVPWFVDEWGHGTQVAGIAAAKDNAIGIVGIAPGARIWGVKVLDRNLYGTEASVLCGLEWVAAHADTIDVVNMSLGENTPVARDGNCGRPPAAKDLFHRAVCDLVDRGVVIVAGAGNDSRDANDARPASYDEVITVSGIVDRDGKPGGLAGKGRCNYVEIDDTMVFFSNYGADVDVAAPAECVVTIHPFLSYQVVPGTSYATPIVAGAAGLLKAVHPAWSPAEVKDRINATKTLGPIPEDRDAFNEGVLDVSSF